MIDAITRPIAGHLERWTASLGNLARPFVLYAASASSAVATVSIVWMRLDLVAGAAFIGATWGGVALLYGAKAAEERGKAKSEAEVEIARASTPPDAPNRP
jgi:hypothetical protein